MFLRDEFNYDRNAAGLESAIECLDKSLTVQSSKDEADINVLVRRFGVTGLMPQGIRPPVYGDFTEVFDYQSAQNAILAAQRSFMALPAEVRSRFSNDPQAFVEFCSNPDNVDEMVKLGLAVKKPDAVVEAPATPA